MKKMDLLLFAFCAALCVSLYVFKKQRVCDVVLKMKKPESVIEHGRNFMSIDRATTYQPTVAQCDENPFTTADGSIINPKKPERWVALSRDLILDEERRELFNRPDHWSGDFRFGDTIEIYSNEHPNLNGFWVVHDCMSPKYSKSIDFLMSPDDNSPKLGVGTDIKIIFCGPETP